jgi:hypothetical protein
MTHITLSHQAVRLQVVFVLPGLYPVTSMNLNYAPVAVGIVLFGALIFFFFPYIGAYRWYRGERHTVEDFSVRSPCLNSTKRDRNFL